MLWRENRYLRELVAHAMPQLQQHLELIEYEQGARIPSERADLLLIFPLTAVFATVAYLPSGESCFTEFHSCRNAAFGRRGDISEDIPYVMEVVGTGFALRIPKERFAEIIGHERWMQLHGWVGSSRLLNAALINSLCNATHSVLMRVSRMLAQAEDAFGPGRKITLQQGQLASYLKIRRESVSEALEPLREHGCITTYRGRIEIANRQRLLDHACSCYEASRALSQLLWGRCKTMAANRTPARAGRYPR